MQSDSISRGGPALAKAIPKELAVSILTVFGVFSTVGVGFILRRILFLKSLVIAGEEYFVYFVTYGLSLSLIAAASGALRKRDTIILVLAATVVWGIFVEAGSGPGMARFMTFASLIVLGVALARRIGATLRPYHRIVLGVFLPGGLCALGGLLYHGVRSHWGYAVRALEREWATGTLWGLALGLAVGLGIAVGWEMIMWTAKSQGQAGPDKL